MDGDAPSPPQAAPALSTGGGGFTFETRAGAFIAAAMVAGEQPLGTDIGVPEQIRLQAGPLGHVLDDVVVTGQDLHPTFGPSVLACSAKIFNMMPGGALLEEFVMGAWRELLREDFREGHDRLGMLCGQAGAGNLRALEQLISAARGDSDAGLAARINVPGAFNATHRTLWSSARCPDELASTHGVDLDSSPSRLLRHLIVRRLDLETPDSEDSARSRAWCRAALVPAQANRDDELLEAVLQAVEQTRIVGGSLTLEDLATVRPGLLLRARPDVEAAWLPLSEASDLALAAVRDTVGAGTHLPRTGAWAQLEESPAAAVVLLTGPSGCGKSALAKRWVSADTEARVLWLSALDLEEGLHGLRGRMGLPSSLIWLLAHVPGHIRVVVDGLDRAFSAAALSATAELALVAERSSGRIELLLPCQELALNRVLRELISRGVEPGPPVLVGDLEDADLQILRAQSQGALLLADQRVREVLRRPKLLDLVLQVIELGVAELGELRDETDVAKLWWSAIALGDGQDRTARSALLQELAAGQADALRSATPVVSLGPAAVETVPALQASGVLAPGNEQMAFAHDLFGDWSRLKRLEAEGETVVTFLPGKELLPLWHRAVRLLALTQLRRNAEDWERMRAALDDTGHRLLGDLFLDAVLFADDAGDLLELLWDRLGADDGALLSRLLTRFLAVATVPDPRGALLFGDQPGLRIHFDARNRVPLWPLWIPVLKTLGARAEQAVELAPAPAARVAELWLHYSEPTWPGRDDAAEIGLAAGRMIIEKRKDGMYFDKDFELALYRAALAAGAAAPARVLNLLGDALTVAQDEIEAHEESRRYGGLPPSVVNAMRAGPESIDDKEDVPSTGETPAGADPPPSTENP